MDEFHSPFSMLSGEEKYPEIALDKYYSDMITSNWMLDIGYWIQFDSPIPKVKPKIYANAKEGT